MSRPRTRNSSLSPLQESEPGVDTSPLAQAPRPVALSAMFRGRNKTKFMTPPARYTDTDLTENSAITFDLLKGMTPSACVKRLTEIPLFLRTMVNDGKLDPEVVNSVALSFTQRELQKFMQNMTQEIQIYNTFYGCKTFEDVEKAAVELLPIKSAKIWLKVDGATFVVSPTTTKVAPISEFPVFTTPEDIFADDVFLPLKNKSGNTRALLHCKNDGLNAYHTEVLKIIRGIIETKFFASIDPTVPANIAALFGEIGQCSLKATVKHACNFLETTISCRTAEIFEFDDDTQIMIRLTDNSRFTEENGGIAYEVAKSGNPVNASESETGGTSVLVQSVPYGRKKYVIVLRGKVGAPAFAGLESKTMSAIAPVISNAIRISRWLENLVSDAKELKTRMTLTKVVNDTIVAVGSGGIEKWKALKKASSEFFGSDLVFLALVDGRTMRFLPGDVTWNVDECTAGIAHGHKRLVVGDPNDEKSKFRTEIYSTLGVSNVRSTIAFPYRGIGKAVGAIEVINPKEIGVDFKTQAMFNNLVTCLFYREPI